MAQFTFVTPVARLIHGHPLKQNVRTDDVTKQPVIGKDGQPVKEISVSQFLKLVKQTGKIPNGVNKS